MKANVEIKAVDFSEILPVWQKQLWPQRTSPIEPTSAITRHGKIDGALINSEHYFYMAFMNQKTAGVISMQKTNEREFRTRGLWVDETFRTHGIGSQLMSHLKSECHRLEANNLWTMARMTAVKFYEKNGFRSVSKIEGYEFGPHVLMECVL